MLVLNRTQGETITIRIGGEEIVIAMVKVDKMRAQVGITAPMHAKILRTELIERDNEKVLQATRKTVEP